MGLWCTAAGIRGGGQAVEETGGRVCSLMREDSETFVPTLLRRRVGVEPSGIRNFYRRTQVRILKYPFFQILETPWSRGKNDDPLNSE